MTYPGMKQASLLLVGSIVSGTAWANPTVDLNYGVPIDIADFPCDVTVTTRDRDWSKVNRSDNQVVCIAPGDHTNKGKLNVLDSGSSTLNGTIDDVTLDNPVTITDKGHGLSNGDYIWIDDKVGGTWQLRWRYFKVTVVDSNRFTLQGENATGDDTQPPWNDYSGGGNWKKIDFKVIRHADAIKKHPYQLAEANRARVDSFHCDVFSKGTHSYIMFWGLTSEVNSARIDACKHTVIAYNDAYSKAAEADPTSATMTHPILLRGGSDFSVVQDNTSHDSGFGFGSDSTGIAVLSDNVGTRVVRNEIWDVSSNKIQYLSEGNFEGTVVAGNAAYVSSDYRSDGKGTVDPNGDFACSETGIVFKGTMPPSFGRVTEKHRVLRVEGNMLFGLRETDEACGGTGTSGAAFDFSARTTKRNLLFRNNVIWDVQQGFTGNNHRGAVVENVGIIGNIFYDVTKSQDSGDAVVFPWYTRSENTYANIRISSNTIKNANYWVNFSGTTDITMECNVLLNAGATYGARDSSWVQKNNSYYGDTNGVTTNDIPRGSVSNANLADLTLQPHVITDPNRNVVLPGVLTTSSSRFITNTCPNYGLQSSVEDEGSAAPPEPPSNLAVN